MNCTSCCLLCAAARLLINGQRGNLSSGGLVVNCSPGGAQHAMLPSRACCISSQKVIWALPVSNGRREMSQPMQSRRLRTRPNSAQGRRAMLVLALAAAPELLLYEACINVLMTSELNCSTPITNGLLYIYAVRIGVRQFWSKSKWAQLYFTEARAGERISGERHSKVSAHTHTEVKYNMTLSSLTQYIECAAPPKWN